MFGVMFRESFRRPITILQSTVVTEKAEKLAAMEQAVKMKEAALKLAFLLGSLQLGLSAAAGYLSAQFYDGTALPMALVMALCVGLGAALILVAPLSGAARGSGRAG